MGKRMLEAGAAAPEFILQTPDGTSHALADILAKGPALLTIYKVGCPTCQYTLPFLERIYRGRTGSAPQIFAISQDKADATEAFYSRFDLTIPALLDPADQKYPASNGFQISSVPSMFLVEQDGKISAAVSGFDKAELRKIGDRFGVQPFREGENVPAMRPG